MKIGMRQTILLAAFMISAAIMFAALICKAYADETSFMKAVNEKACPIKEDGRYINLPTSKPTSDPSDVYRAARACAIMIHRCIPEYSNNDTSTKFMYACYYDWGVRYN